MKTLKFFIFSILAFSLLISCGARKVKKQKEEYEQLLEAQKREYLDSLAKMEKANEMRATQEKKEVDIKIVPVNEKPVEFNVMYNGQELKGFTNGELEIKDREEKRDTIIKVVEKVINHYQKGADGMIKVIERETKINKEAEKAEAWIFYLMLILLVVILLDSISKRVKIWK